MNKHDMTFRHELPNNIEAEQALLGAILTNNVAFDRVSDVLAEEHFYEPLHAKIYKVASDLIRAGRKADAVLVKSFLPANDKVGDKTVAQYLLTLISEAMPVSGARDYALAIHDAWIGRKAIGALEQGVDIYYGMEPDKDPLSAFEPIEEIMATLRAERIRGENRKQAGQAYLDDMQAAYARGDVRGVPICLEEIGEVISEPCFEAGNLYGLLSSSGEGKTSLTLQIISHALRAGHPTIFLSFDQNRVQCVRQMVAQHHGIEARRQRNPKLLSAKEWDNCVGFANWLDQQPFEVVKCTDHSAPQLVGFARTFVKRHKNGKVPFVVVDHIGSVKPEDRRADEGTKAKEINKIFKAGAETTDAAWLVLNQRNSYGMKRDNPRPISADLFGGDPAKQAYDAIMYLYRQEKFKAERVSIAASDADWKKINRVFGSEVEGVAEIGAVKVRFGSPSITRELRFEDRFTRYVSERRQDQAELIEGGF